MSAQVLLGEILHGGVGGQMATDPSFYYDPATQTLHVPAITSASQTFAGETTIDFTTTGNTIIGDAGADTLVVNATTSLKAVTTFDTSVKLQFRNTTSFLQSASDGTLNIASTTVAIAGITTVTGTLAVSSTTTVTSASASALAVGLAGATNPSFVVDSSTAVQAAGLKVTGAIAAGTVAVAVISSGADANLTINAKGTGTIGIGTVSTGAVTITPATTITGASTHSSTTALVGVTTVTAAAGIVSSLATTNQRIVPFFGAGTHTTAAAAGAIVLTNYQSYLDSNAGATTQTLAASTIVGQVKRITMIVDGGDDVVTVTSLSGGTTITFSNIGDTWEGMWNGTNWITLAKHNEATGSLATPVIA